jgi:predicted cupin superfamily sugar epimerase
MGKTWLCRVGRHRWQRLRGPEGGWYRECRRCGKQGSSGGGGPMMIQA